MNAFLFLAVLPVVAYAFASHGVTLSKFEEQEAAERKRGMRICQALIEERCASLVKQVLDYASWDEAYDVVRKPDPSWLYENLTSWVPSHLDIQVFILADANRHVVASAGTTPSLTHTLLGSARFGRALAAKTSHGLVRDGSEVYMVAVAPVVPTTYRAAPDGALIFAKRLNSAFVTRLAVVADLGLALYVDRQLSAVASNLPATDLPTEPVPAFSRPDEMAVRVRPDQKRIFVWRRLKDWNGRDIAAMVTSTSRQITLGNRFDASLRSLLLVATCLLAALLAARQVRAGILARRALVDELTQLPNHRYLQERLAMEISRADRGRCPLSVAMLDIDRFKNINDEFGHLVGDQALKQLADLLADAMRESDVVARYGGEEFLIIMPRTSLKAAMAVAERLREKVEDAVFEARVHGATGRHASKVCVRFTVSLGVAAYPDHAQRGDELIMAADLALFAAKHASRNAVYSYSSISGDESASGHDPLRIHLEMREGSLSAVRSLAAAVDARDHRMRGHSEKVACCALAIGRAMGLSVEEMSALRGAALLHDLGNIAIPDAILWKPGPLTSEERAIMMTHAVRGAEILAKAPQLAQVAEIVRHHHEWVNGQGYPDGLGGDLIPLASRIIAAADAFDAMTSERPHRPASAAAQALRGMQELAGTQFDPDVVRVLGELLETDKLLEVLSSYQEGMDLAA